MRVRVSVRVRGRGRVRVRVRVKSLTSSLNGYLRGLGLGVG